MTSKEDQEKIKKAREELGNVEAKEMLDDLNENRSAVEVILFFSFDIVNSSKYKNTNYNVWFLVLDEIFKKIARAVENGIAYAEYWRSIGDEVVFIKKIFNRNELEETIEQVYKVLLNLVDEIKKGNIYDGINELDENERDMLKKQNILSLKSTAWIAEVNKSSGKSVLNVRYRPEAMDRLEESIDFQGNDIDAGFRIAKAFTSDRRLTLSFELAFILSEDSIFNGRIYIIGFEKLKGIWDDHLYPIIWYYDETVNQREFDKSFYYDEHIENEMVKNYYMHKNMEYISDTTAFAILSEILLARGLKNKVDSIKKRFKGTLAKNEDRSIKRANEKLEVHCVAVCYNEEDKKILMFQRKKEVKLYPGKIDFGCSQMKGGYTFASFLEKDYKEQFGIVIKVKEPFREYSFDDEDTGRKVVGIRFRASIKSIDINEIQYNSSCEYASAIWINKENINKYEKDFLEPNDFKKIIKLILGDD